MKGESDLDYEAAFTQDLTRAQERIRQMTGWTPTCFAYPFGAISDGTQTMLKTMGFQSSMTCESHTNRITRDPECLFGLGRYLRPGLQSTEAFFCRKSGYSPLTKERSTLCRNLLEPLFTGV